MSSEAALTQRQHGVITRAQLRALGVSKHQIERRLATRRLIALRPGVFAAAGAPHTDRMRLWAAQLWAGADSTLSHRAGASLWRLESVLDDGPELWSPRRLRARDLIAHRGLVEPRDRGRLDGLWVTSAARTLIDLAAVVDEETLETAVEDARRRKLVMLDRLRRDRDRLAANGRTGIAALRRVLDALDGTAPAESVLEVRVIRILRAAGVAAPVRQFEVVVGGRRFRIDLAWPAMTVGIECEGYTTHGRRRSGVRARSEPPGRPRRRRLANHSGHVGTDQ